MPSDGTVRVPKIVLWIVGGVVSLMLPAILAWCAWVSTTLVAIEVRMENHSDFRGQLISVKADVDVLRSTQAKMITEIELLKMKTLDMPRIPASE